MKGHRFKSILLCCTLLGLAALALLGNEFYRLVSKPMLSENSAPVTLKIDKNTTASSLVKMLESKHLIKSDRLLLALIRIQGLAPKLKAGTYQIKPGESAQQLLNKINSGKVMVESFRIIEGSTLNQVIANLQKAPNLKSEYIDWHPIIANHSSAEGLLLADTYNYDAGSEAKPLLKLANQKLQEYLAESWKNRSADLPYQSPYELLIAASILEKESAISEERKIISGIIVNRIKKQMPLQMDPTVIYALGQNYKGKLSHEDMSVHSAYNTYINRGLPPTPIAMVGKNAIDAAAHPQLSNYLYFVAKGDGSHQFSATYEEQKEAILRHQNQRSQ